MTALTTLVSTTSGPDAMDTLNAWSKGRDAAILIAPANAPAYVKDRADYILGGVNDYGQINTILNNLPTLPDFERSKVLVKGAKYGDIRVAGGRLVGDEPIVLPNAFVGRLNAAGVPSWRPIDALSAGYEGGTQFYSTAPTGQILVTPQYTGNRTDTGVSNTIPVTGLDMSGIDFRVFNPTTTQGFAAVDLSGVTTGDVSRINVHSDNNTNPTHRISQGIAWNAGARTDRKTLRSVAVSGFRDAAFSTATTHLHMELLAACDISGGTSSCGFQIGHDQDCTYEQLHAFSTGIGAKIGGTLPIDMKSMMFESVSELIRLTDANAQALFTHRIQHVELNGDVNWGGYLATNFVVENVTKFNLPQLRTRNRLQVTIAAGATTGSLAHNLIAAPTSQIASPRADIGSGNRAWLTTDATNATVTLASAAPAGGVTFDVDVRCA